MRRSVKVRRTPTLPLMSHEERQAIIRQPFACEMRGGCCERTTRVPGRSWGGCAINRELPSRYTGFDESYLRYSEADDPRQGEL